jgi:mRNA-degrading endonuclease YafQ of YafQ-DinJ toxin-antitoxin module
MAYKLIYPESYNKRARKFLQKHPALKKQYQKTLELLELDPYHPSLRLHALTGKLKGLSAIAVTLSYRIVIEMIVTEKNIILINVGSHEEVY